MAFTKLEPNSVNSAASFTFAEVTAGNIKTDNLQYANGDIWTFGSYITGASGANTQVQFNTDGNFDASSAFTFDSDTSTLSATNIQGNGAGLSHLTGANVTGEVTHAASANAVAGANVSGEVSFAATANAVAGANVSGEVLNAAIANSVAGANISGQVANALVAGTVYTNAQPNITSVGTLSSLAVTTTLTAGDATFNSGSISTDLTVTGNLTVSGTTTTVSTVNITSSNTTITLHDPGHELYSDDGKDIGILMRIFNSADDHAFFGRAADTGAIEYYSSGSMDENSVYTGIYGNIKAASFISNVSTGTAPFIVNSTTPVANLNAASAGTVTTAAQPNITSVGVLSNLFVSGNTNSGNANLGNLTVSNFFSGNGSLLTSISGANVTGFVPNANVANTALTVSNISTVNDVATNATYYPVFQTATGGSNPLKTASSSLTYNPNTATLRSNTVSATVMSTSNLVATGTVNLGALTNVKLTGGLPGQVVSTDGLGNLTWATGGTGGGSGSSGGAGFISVTKDTFTATGSANTFTISITPTSVAYIVVNIDGIVQQLDAYSLATNVVTLTGMPNAGEVIEITSYGVGGLPGGANTQIQFNNSNVFSGSPALTFNTTTSTLTASKYSGNGAGLSSIAGANVTGFVPNANVANTALAVSATSLPDVTSIGTLVSLDVTGNLSSGNANLGNLVIANFFSGNGNSISNIAGANVKGQVGNANIADQVYSSSQPNITSLGNLVSLTVAGTTTSQQTTETLIPITGAQGTVSHDFTSGALFVHTSMVSNFTVNVRYVPTTTNRTIVVVLILIQGSAPVVPSALQIDGAAQTINWANGITPSGYANKKDMVTFTLMRTGTSWTVFGQLATYG